MHPELIPGATPIPPDLIEYLLDMISPPGERALWLGDLVYLTKETTTGWKDNSLPGILLRGQPTEAQAKEFMRALRPGAHFLLIAPDEEPTGHTGACTIEDNGLEIRDAILWVREPGFVHYIPKASRDERDTGARHLEAKGTIHNTHPCVKPAELMERLLRDVPARGLVVDPFNGSGSTGIAAVATGHNYVGIEREAEYVTLSAARAEHRIEELEQDGEIPKDSVKVRVFPEELHVRRPKRKGARRLFGQKRDPTKSEAAIATEPVSSIAAEETASAATGADRNDITEVPS